MSHNWPLVIFVVLFLIGGYGFIFCLCRISAMAEKIIQEMGGPDE